METKQYCSICNHAAHEPDQCPKDNCGASEICHGDLPGEGTGSDARAMMGYTLGGLAHVVPTRRKRYGD